LVIRGTMGVSSLPNTVTRQRRGCDLNPGPTAPESSTLKPLGYRATVDTNLIGEVVGGEQGTCDRFVSDNCM